MASGTAVKEVTEIILAGAGELLGEDSPYERGRRALQREFSQVIVAAKELVKVDSQDDAEKAAQFGRLLQVGQKETESFFKSIKVQIDAIKSPVLAAEKQDIGAIEGEKKRIGVMLTTYNEKVERERQAEERKAREAYEAQLKAEREEQERIAREEQLARAIAAEEDGDLEQANAVLEEEIVVPEPTSAPVVIQAAAPAKIAGSVGSTKYSAKVTSLMTLVKAVAEGRAPIQALSANESFINQQARSFKEGFSLPGCELVKEKATSFRS